MATTMHLRFEPGVVTQVDFGSGPMLEHHDGRIRRAWGGCPTDHSPGDSGEHGSGLERELAPVRGH